MLPSSSPIPLIIVHDVQETLLGNPVVLFAIKDLQIPFLDAYFF